jgi:hypothetical protein
MNSTRLSSAQTGLRPGKHDCARPHWKSCAETLSDLNDRQRIPTHYSMSHSQSHLSPSPFFPSQDQVPDGGRRRVLSGELVPAAIRNNLCPKSVYT